MDVDPTKDLFRVRRTTCQMLKARGYLVDDSDAGLTFEEFCERFKDPEKEVVLRDERMILRTCLISDPDNEIFAFFPDDEKVGRETVEKYKVQMEKEGVKRAILVLKKDCSSMARTHIAKQLPAYDIEVFLDNELFVNITEHELVPKHEPLDDAQKKQLLDGYRLKPEQLPRILRHDAVARFYGLRKGHVVKITRPSETAGRYVTYRMCQ